MELHWSYLSQPADTNGLLCTYRLLYSLHFAFFLQMGLESELPLYDLVLINMGATNLKSKYSSIHTYICTWFLWPLWERFPCR